MISKSEFSLRRKQLMKSIGKNGIAIVPAAPEKLRNSDADYLYRPDSDFFYLSGFAEPEALLILIPGRSEGQYVLLCRERDPAMETWTGRRAGLDGAIEEYGADQAYPIDHADEILPRLIEGRERVFFAFGNDETFDAKLMSWVNIVRKKARTGVQAPQEFVTLNHLLHEMRLIKSRGEINVMRRAAEIAAEAHCRAMKMCRPDIEEFKVEAELLHTFRSYNCHPAYNSIVGSGANACVLHYVENNAQLKDGELLLIDAGAEYNFYASDITRTFPVNGKFSPEQKALYELVLESQLAAIKCVKPGNHWNKPHDAAVRVLTKGLIELGILKGELNKLIKDGAYRPYYMHRTGHWLGMDVHDVGEYKINGKWRDLQPGMVLTVEPGLYIPAGSKGVAKKWWDIGIRIEDDVLVTKSGNDVLSKDVPKSVRDIEELMAV